jgi:hypothetical protein
VGSEDAEVAFYEAGSFVRFDEKPDSFAAHEGDLGEVQEQ